MSLQYEYSLWSRDPEEGHHAACRDLGMGLMAYAPLGYGFLTGSLGTADALPEGDSRWKFPRFQAENFSANRGRVSDIEALARARGATPAQIALAWLLARGGDVFPIPGCKSREHLDENAGTLEIELTAADMEALDRAFPAGAAAGTRYPEEGMRRVNL